MINSVNSNSLSVQAIRQLKKLYVENGANEVITTSKDATNQSANASNFGKRVMSIEDLIAIMQRAKNSENKAASEAATTSVFFYS